MKWREGVVVKRGKVKRGIKKERKDKGTYARKEERKCIKELKEEREKERKGARI